ncbi:myopalladin-like isoform X2 [Carassius auratus]|nr:myopalladin-like isoform X2 [Carassius auratus]
MAPQYTHSQGVSYPPLSKITSPHLVRNPPAPAPIPSPMSHSTLIDIQPPLPGIIPISTQSFTYTRPKEFVAAQTLSPIRSPSPTESPVPMLHELAAQIFPKSTRELTSPINQLSPSPRKFPTRVLECPSSPPYVSSPPLLPHGLGNSLFSFRTQSPPQASSPTSSSSSHSPIQNPVAFLTSVLPSLPTSPLTNAMGLPKSAPPGPQGALKKNQRGSRLMSDDDIRESKETLLQDIEKILRFKDEQLHFGQQEYKVSSFEQRLLSEIEFRLERTPVEESDDEVHHDEIPTGKCIAPIFDKKLKHFRAVEGIPVTFTCKVVGIPVPKVYWFKDGKQILKKNEHYKKIREGDGTCSLHIEAVTSDDDGNYTVMAANPQGRISCSGHLIVQTGPVRNRPVVHSQRVRARVQEVEGEPTEERFFRPHFLQAPGDMSAHEGQLCRLDCKVSGLPHPEIMWLLNGKPMYPDLSHRMLVRENGIHSLVIDPLTQADDGTYTCIASNKAGQSSFCLELRVVGKELKQAPHFVEKLQNTGIAEGSPVRLECRVVGMPQPVIYWKKDNDTIPHSKARVSMHQDTTGYVCLLIQPTRKEDAGWYTVSAKNEAGIISCTARLDIYAQWYQHINAPMKKTQLSGSRYAALTGQGLDIKSAFSMSDNSPVIFSASQPERRLESEEL